MLEDFFAKISGIWFKKKLDLEEGPMDGVKPWYKSLTIWTGVVTVLIATYNSVSTNVHQLPVLPDWILAFLGAVGVYGRARATDKLVATQPGK